MRTPVLLLLLSVAALPHTLPAQQSPTPAPPSPLTLHSQAKLVIVDVVVTDRDHHPIHNLKPQDFTILESKSPQQITSFEEHKPLTPDDALKIKPLPPMPAGTFSNYSPVPPNSAVNILLIDSLNTSWNNQTNMRAQAIKYLRNARPGANMAIFGLSTSLVMFQGFTTDPAALKAAIVRQTSKASPLLHDPINGAQAPTAAQANADMHIDMAGDQQRELQAFLDIEQSVNDTTRARYTLDAMNTLAHYLSAIPGRKNLIWFSGGFPLDIFPDTTNATNDRFIGTTSSEQEYRETAKLFAASQIAIYPIDARGLMLDHGMAGNMKAADPFFTMFKMADDTGGHAFINTNGFAEAVDTAIEDGSTYYTIAYRPTDQAESGRFRKTDVKVPGKNYLLEYRHGYFEDDPNHPRPAVGSTDAPDNSRTLILRAMAHGLPNSSEIIFKARVLPAAATPAAEAVSTPESARHPLPPDDTLTRRYTVDYAVLPNDIIYTTTPDGLRHFDIEFITLAYRPNGTIAAKSTKILKGNITPAQFTTMQRFGFTYHQEIAVPIKEVGTCSLRLGVHDRTANRAGTTEISVANIKSLEPASSGGTSSPPVAALPHGPDL